VIARADIPKKPRPDFPLTPRKDGRWCKRVKGKLWVFSGTADEALAEWDRVKEDLYKGLRPRSNPSKITVADVCNAFIAEKRKLVNSGELQPLVYRDYWRICETVVAVFGRTRLAADVCQDDFLGLRMRLARSHLGTYTNVVRMLFKHACEEGVERVAGEFGQCVYFVATHNLSRVKIGYTTNLRARLDSLKTASPVRLRLLHSTTGTLDEEKRLHEAFRHLRCRSAGKEWFYLRDELREYLSHQCETTQHERHAHTVD
jgi:hypothetical protein